MKTIIEMAREVGMIDSYDPSEKYISVLERFAALVRADERAALSQYFNNHWRSDWSDWQIITAIEANGNI